MGSKRRTSKDGRSSINYWRIPLEAQSFKPDNLCSSGDGYAQPSASHTKSCSQSGAKSSVNRVSTSQLLSAAAGIWDCVGQSAIFQTKANLRYDTCQKENIICISSNGREHESQGAPVASEDTWYDLKSRSRFSSTAELNFEDLKTLKKQLLFASCNRNIIRLFIQNNSHAHVDSSCNIANSCDSQTREDQLKFTGNGSGGEIGSFMVEEKNLLADLSASHSTENCIQPEGLDSSSRETLKLAENVLHTHNPIYANYSLQPLISTKAGTTILRNPNSSLHSDNSVESLMSVDCASCQQQQETDLCNMMSESLTGVSGTIVRNDHESGKDLFHDLVTAEEFPAKHWLSIQDKVQQAFVQNRHAFAGALAGTLVSLSLHPVDTIKTVIQSNVMGQKSFYDTLRTIIAEKGMSGLYRGIATNVASSAPISAIYTYTYESVKGALLPIVSKEYHSFAHCIAGGCSSVATSFVFTPSERIKQQMQVGSQYQNCWSALIACVGKGGLRSLYAGWGAVLCRNIPHSIIKFYTYERLKRWSLRSASSGASPNTLQTLVCGGLSGSTAALFTTPFDVVKTRLQTQTPGTLAKYSGVLQALRQIAREEGLQGLYRGLTPRLAMYVSQGAIFFASYEFLKAVFSLETPTSPIVVVEEKADDPTPTRIQTLHI